MKRFETTPAGAPARRALPLLAALLLLVALSVAPAVAAQESGDPVGEVAWVEGTLTGQPEGGSVAPLAVSDAVLFGMELRTGERSSAVLTIHPDGRLDLADNDHMRIDQVRIDESGAHDSKISVFLGNVKVFLGDLFHGRFTVETVTSSIGVKGTVFAVRVVPSGDTTVWAIEAAGDDVTVTSKATGTSVVLPAGYVTVVARGAAPTPPVPFDSDSGVPAGIALPPPPVPPGIFDQPLLPPERDNLPPDRGQDGKPPVLPGSSDGS